MLYRTDNPHGGDVYGAPVRLDFSANVNPLGPPPRVIAALQAAAADVRQYPDPYCRALLAAIAAHESLPPETILCGAGAAELIYAYCDALRPRRVMELAPTFSEYSAAARHFGAAILRHPLSAEAGFLPDGRLLDSLARERPDVLFLCSPNNPTGRLLPRPLLEQVLERCRAQSTQVLLDECFLDFTDAPSAKDLLPAYPNLLILKALTKSYALAGVRVGYCLAADAALLGAMASSVQPWNVSLPAQAAGAAALQEPDWPARARVQIAAERAFLSGGLRALGLEVIPSEANYLLFSAPPGLDTALRRDGIAIRNCANYSGLGPGWYRTAVRLHEENAALLTALRRCMEDPSWH